MLCLKCLESEFEYRQVNTHIGEFCKKCGTWQRWVPLEEVRKKNLVIVKDPDNLPLF
jgi:hypothetical protein